MSGAEVVAAVLYVLGAAFMWSFLHDDDTSDPSMMVAPTWAAFAASSLWWLVVAVALAWHFVEWVRADTLGDK